MLCCRSLSPANGGSRYCVVLQVTVPSGTEEGTVECEVVGSVVEIDRAVALIQESIQQSELSRRRKALHSHQKTRKPAVRRSHPYVVWPVI